MSRRGIAAIAGLLILAIGIAYAVSRWRSPDRPDVPPSTAATPSASAAEALARLRVVPWYRGALRAEAVRGGSVDPDGTVHIDIDPRALLAPRAGAEGAALRALLPPRARGTIELGEELHEVWLLEGASPLLDLLDRKSAAGGLALARESIPGTPSAVVAARLAPARLADPRFGGEALASWRERVDLVERMFGRPLRAQLAEDLAGPVAFAVYDHAGTPGADALLAVALDRSDRIRQLLDAVFALGTLTDRATTRRYRDVAIGSFTPGSAGRGLAFAVDGRVLLVASSGTRLEEAIDARRAGAAPRALDGDEPGARASWSARTTSAFVAHGWSRLARAPESRRNPRPTMWAQIRPEGASSWRLESRGPDPAITADPLLPFLRSVLARRQREDG
ncbi:MAG TPA: hypothetical protein VFB67_10045 [Candidatus Polarisedimenticolaceae bacterium]|nr:hypothetical protein [Candidatus Polarisedimenticolaceae bacterium]